MLFREATPEDIQQIQIVRHSVKENILSNPDLVTDTDCREYMMVRGKGWVCETNGQIIGFAIADLKRNNIWALFVKPENEGMGIGKKLHDIMLNWYFNQTQETVWLGTAPKTRAEDFYKKCGWKHLGALNTFEEKFEMSYSTWEKITI
jgi:GNAT superfamily N-acetyltransferase